VNVLGQPAGGPTWAGAGPGSAGSGPAAGSGATSGAAGRATAPPAPGRLGAPLDPAAAAAYLDALGRWRDERKRELDQLDQAALAARDGAHLVGDITLSMALWKAVSDRYELLLASWDGGRVGRPERERMASLIWGRLDATLDPSLLARVGGQPQSGPSGAGLAVSLPEACRLSDALVSQLRVRLGFDPSGAVITERLRQLRAQMERIRDQIDLEPAGVRQQQAAEQQSRLARRLKDITDKAARGGDVAGLLGPLEIEAATFERDLIVAAARRRETGAKVGRARSLRADLAAREAALRTIVDQCLTAVDPAPNYAVPAVDALGPVPNTADALDGYLRRLEQVARAMTMAQDAYTAALRNRDELAGRLEAYQVKAQATGVAEQPDVRRAYELARDELGRRPTRMALASQLVGLFQTYLQTARPAAAGASGQPGEDVETR
jgi:hypothetical protein